MTDDKNKAAEAEEAAAAAQVKEVKKWPASVILTIPFFFIAVPIYNLTKKVVSWRAAASMIATFSVIAFVAGHFSVLHQHWIWNPARTLGPTIWKVPIEEPLLYYWFPPLFVVLLFHAVEDYLKRKRK